MSAFEQYIGTIYETAGPIGANDVTNFEDHYWNLGGSTGPDITTLQGYWLMFNFVY